MFATLKARQSPGDIVPGGAPEWVVRGWMQQLINPDKASRTDTKKTEDLPVLQLLEKDFARLAGDKRNLDDVLRELLDVDTEGFEFPDDDQYSF